MSGAEDGNEGPMDKGKNKPWVVGVGASAGGLEALQTFFASVPPNTGLAYVVIQHLSPDYKSLMVELLSKSTAMRVCRIEDNMAVEPDTVYLIPPKKNVTLFHGRLMLEDTPSGGGLNLPIDIFLRSLAEDFGERAVAVILSGSGSDGTRGVRAIKEAGGMVMVQEAATAKFDGMPGSAIATGLADIILPPGRLPEALLKFVQHPWVEPDASRPGNEASTEDATTRILALLRKHSGVDFTYYKPTTVVRRIERRMGITQVAELDDYLRLLQSQPSEAGALVKDLLIGVTKFFRDTDAFASLTSRVIPEIFRRRKRSRSLRVWVAGCSSGEEAYSMAMLLREYLDTLDEAWEVKVFATDIDRHALEVAGAGIYPANIVAEMAPERLRRFFTEHQGTYRVTRELREMVVFAPHNLLRDPPFTRIDLVSCRNLLIYLQTVVQKRVLQHFAFSIQEEGFLFLGPSETTGDAGEFFEVLDPKWKIFERRPGAPSVLDAALAPARDVLLRSQFTPVLAGRRSDGSLDEALVGTLNTRLLREFAPACLVVDETGSLLHSFGAMPPFLRPPEGKATLSVLKMLPREMALPVSTALHKAGRDREIALYRGIRLADAAGGPLVWSVRVEPIAPTSRNPLLHLLFLTPEDQVAVDPGPDREIQTQDLQAQRIQDLEQELQMTRENLQATVEELETSNEELQATNEELLAANEELQSTNEELQSVNEELYTVNAEYQSKITELSTLQQDTENLLSASEVGCLFLDAALRIRKFTAAVGRDFGIMAHDVGRPLTDLGSPHLKALWERLKESAAEPAATSDITLRTEDGRWLLMRIVAETPEAGAPAGFMVTTMNITARREAEEALARNRAESASDVDRRTAQLREQNHALAAMLQERESRVGEITARQQRFRLTLEQHEDAVSILVPVHDAGGRFVDFTVTDVNHHAEGAWGQPRDRIIGQRLSALLAPDLFAARFEIYRQVAESGTARDERGESPSTTRTRIVPLDRQAIAIFHRD